MAIIKQILPTTGAQLAVMRWASYYGHNPYNSYDRVVELAKLVKPETERFLARRQAAGNGTRATN